MKSRILAILTIVAVLSVTTAMAGQSCPSYFSVASQDRNAQEFGKGCCAKDQEKSCDKDKEKECDKDKDQNRGCQKDANSES